MQRARLLMAARWVVAEHGYWGMTVARVTARSRVSRKTFYELFDDREDCFLALFEEAVAEIAPTVVSAFEEGRGWRGRMRAGLGALLGVFDDEPAVALLCVVEALGGGLRVLELRGRILQVLMDVVDRGRLESSASRGLPVLTAEGVVGAVLSVLYTRISERGAGSAASERGVGAAATRRLPAGQTSALGASGVRGSGGEPLVELLGPLMSMIVLPYLGPAAAHKELSRPVPAAAGDAGSRRGEHDPLQALEMRLTYRTLRVLAAIAARPGANNREIADQAGIIDQGQASKLYARLERLGLIHNTGPQLRRGASNAWRLTANGQRVQETLRV
ncbi:MAG TPA: TetR family transcriptional regulator [Solirubrobacteraceae bacterium]|nr:TetR family transcriptional regulator [Solirubrobacteraceae bacterium]